MKRLIQLIALLIISLPLLGQVSISVEPSSFVLTGSPSQTDVTYHIQVTNQSGVEVGILWERFIETPPSGWLSWICDKNLCYLPTSNACAPNKPNILGPGEQMDLQVHVNPTNNEGSTSYDIKLTDYSDTSIVLGYIN